MAPDPPNDDVSVRGFDAGVDQQTPDCGGGRRNEPGVTGDESAHVHRVEAVDILGGTSRCRTADGETWSGSGVGTKTASTSDASPRSATVSESAAAGADGDRRCSRVSIPAAAQASCSGTRSARLRTRRASAR